jgi:hypothetical protein
MTCIGKEMDDLRSCRARNCVGCTEKNLQLTPYACWVKVGRLHSDLETLAISDPDRAKIIRFSRAAFNSDRQLLLKEQVECVKIVFEFMSLPPSTECRGAQRRVQKSYGNVESPPTLMTTDV